MAYAHTPITNPALTRSRALRRASPPAPPRALAPATFAPGPAVHASSPLTARAYFNSYPASAFPCDDAYPDLLYPLAEAPHPHPQPQPPAPTPADALIFRIAADAFEACFHRGMDLDLDMCSARGRRPVCPLMVRT
ncbi:hypothetical protein B0H11DRAFT_2230553 [Mycena galericulata]|nr:hypothetical protein B0H11DRAFT_2230553 [Mycena galericulata]